MKRHDFSKNLYLFTTARLLDCFALRNREFLFLIALAIFLFSHGTFLFTIEYLFGIQISIICRKIDCHDDTQESMSVLLPIQSCPEAQLLDQTQLKSSAIIIL